MDYRAIGRPRRSARATSFAKSKVQHLRAGTLRSSVSASPWKKCPHPNAHELIAMFLSKTMNFSCGRTCSLDGRIRLLDTVVAGGSQNGGLCSRGGEACELASQTGQAAAEARTASSCGVCSCERAAGMAGVASAATASSASPAKAEAANSWKGEAERKRCCGRGKQI